MQQQKQLGTVVDGLLEQVQAYGIKDITICEYQVVCHKLLSYAQEKGDFFYSKRLTDEFRILKTTKEGYLTINCEASCLLKNSKIAIFFNGKWLSGMVARDERGWYLKDDCDNIVGLCPGIKARLLP